MIAFLQCRFLLAHRGLSHPLSKQSVQIHLYVLHAAPGAPVSTASQAESRSREGIEAKADRGT